ncbi:hypothetical protein HC891_06675 [Candidatus Gracilibacteria bacterium]|nr:hypothetical protein [Candidatus Gracilibacteria bacterium]
MTSTTTLERGVVQLRIDGELITTTPEHPFFTLERGWVAAGDLQLGDTVRNASGGSGAIDSFAIEVRTQQVRANVRS